MAFQGQPLWAPLESSDGDLGSTYRPIDVSQDNTECYGHESIHFRESVSSPCSSYNDGYELKDQSEKRSAQSSTTLLSLLDPSIQNIAPGRDSTRKSRFKQQFSGWKVGVVVCASTATAVCLLNIILTIWAATTDKTSGGLGYLYKGDCSKVASMSLRIHLAINVFSTLLLSSSNYTMQVISSPTRKEVDLAHQRGRWYDVGIPSTRNLTGISWTRIVMWSILALSSTPLHLMYNTAVFASTTANAYTYIVASQDFLQSNTTNYDNLQDDPYDQFQGVFKSMHAAAVSGSLLHVNNLDCMQKYGRNFVSNARNVLLVTTNTNVSNSIIAAANWMVNDEVPYHWLCGDGWDPDPYINKLSVCTLEKAQAGASSWKVSNYPISYCLVEQVEEECKLQYSLVIMIIVILANATKAAIMILTWRTMNTPTLVTLGDAVTSFLDYPDQTTAGICLTAKRDILKWKSPWNNQGAKQWVPIRHFWFRAASLKRWLICNILCWAAIIFGIYLLRLGMGELQIYDLKILWQLGFGQVNSTAVVNIAPPGLIGKILFANLPQGILSFLYLTYNGLYSCMLGAHEWSLFATRQRTVRVSSPVGKQRSTYYLQLPYWYAVPLLILSGILHWLMSQSLFLVLVNVLDNTGQIDNNETISTVGYSCIAIFFAIIVGAVAVTAGVINGFRRYNSGIPLVGSCSAAISAACHRPNDDSSASLLPLQWGCVDADSGNNIGHCCLTSFDVTAPKDGNFYAGKEMKQA